MEYDLTGVKKITMDYETRKITIEGDFGSQVFTEEEIEKVSMKDSAWTDESDEKTEVYFDNARCSINREKKELVCGD